MFSQFQIPRGATVPYLDIQITEDGRIVQPGVNDLYGCADQKGKGVPLPFGTVIKPHMYKCGRTPTEVALQGTVEILDADNGIVRYKWHPNDLQCACYHYFQFWITFPDGSLLKFPFLLETLVIEVT